MWYILQGHGTISGAVFPSISDHHPDENFRLRSKMIVALVPSHDD